MAVRKRQTTAVTPGIPAGLYRGLRVACETGYPKRGPSSRDMHQWALDVRTAGYTVRGLCAASESDPEFQSWLRHEERRRPVAAQETESTP